MPIEQRRYKIFLKFIRCFFFAILNKINVSFVTTVGDDMLATILAKLFGTKNERELRRIAPIVHKINALEPSIKALDDAALAGKTDVFRERLAQGESLNSLLPEAFAVVREAAWRKLGQRHFDVQLIGGVVLHEGKISEMRTGEGKTLTATLPLYLNALEG